MKSKGQNQAPSRYESQTLDHQISNIVESLVGEIIVSNLSHRKKPSQ